jgi:hypothetical protein
MCKPELGGELVSRDAHLNRRVVRTECWEPMAHAHWLCTKLHSVIRWKQLHCANEAGIRTLENFPVGDAIGMFSICLPRSKNLETETFFLP